jgi:hypothetical protein
MQRIDIDANIDRAVSGAAPLTKRRDRIAPIRARDPVPTPSQRRDRSDRHWESPLHLFQRLGSCVPLVTKNGFDERGNVVRPKRSIEIVAARIDYLFAYDP